MPSRHDPFPFEAARDLIGILRALYVATEKEEGGKRRLEAILRCGRSSARRSRSPARPEPDTLGYDAAWRRAEAATRQAINLIEEHDADRADAGSSGCPRVAQGGERSAAPPRYRTALRFWRQR